MKDIRIIFMGTPEFAVESLKTLVEQQENIIAVITAPDKPKGRGRKVSISPVKEYALTHDLPVLQPTNLKSPDFIKELRDLNADLQIVVAFRMLPEVVWSMPPLGTFNLHASLLPQYRGAAPINWAIMNGETTTGATTFFIKHEIDTGSIILQEQEPIYDTDNVGSLYDRLMKKGAQLVLSSVQLIRDDSYTLTPQQDTGQLKSAPKLFKEDCRINWNRPAVEVYNFVRGLSPYPAAWAELNGRTFKVFQVARTQDKNTPFPMDTIPGTVWSDDKKEIWVATADTPVKILDLQLQGKKRLKTEEFLRGNKI